MNNSNELDQLVESFLQPKKSTTLGLKELFALFEEVQKINEIYTSPVIPSSEKKGYEKEHESITMFYKTYNEVLAKNIPEGSDPIDKIQNFIKFVNRLVESKGEAGTNLSSTYAAIIFTSSLYKLIQDFIPDQPQSAGFFFEKFINLLFTTGKVQIEGETDKLPIEDIQVNMGGKDYYLSLKFVKSKKISGSIGNMLRFFGNKHDKTYKLGNHQFSLINFQNGKPIALIGPDSKPDKQIIYIIATKPSSEEGQQSIVFNMYQFGFQQFLDMLGEENANKYNNYVKDPKSAQNADISILRQEKSSLEDILQQDKFVNFQRVKDELEKKRNQLKDTQLSIQRAEEEEKEFDSEEAGYENPYKEDLLDKLKNTEGNLKFKIEDLENEIKYDFGEVSENFTELQDRLQVVNNLIISKTGDRSSISESHLQFSIYPTALANNNTKAEVNLSLSLTSQQRDTILQNNKSAFTEVIDQIIEEANVINYKVNNYLLSIDNERVSDQKREQLAKEAYDSATKLQNNLGINTGIAPVDNKPK